VGHLSGGRGLSHPGCHHHAAETAIVILALGLLERDGVALSIGLIIGFLALVIVFLALAGLAAVLHGWFAQ
jgi:hypothetical protein